MINESIYREAILIREFENLLLKLFSQGKLNGTVHTCVGQELTSVFAGKYANQEDTFFSNHRGHGHYLTKTKDTKGLLAEIMGKKSGCSSGFGGSQHLYFENEFYSNGIQGGMTPVATGFAYSKMKRGQNGISFVFIGDGTLGEGILYESLNLASIYGTPVIFILENNQYAQSTSFNQTFGGSTQQRFEGFGLKYYNTNIWDVKSMDETFKDATTTVRSGRPAVIEVECYRLNSHSKGDDNRNLDEIKKFKEKDLLHLFEKEFSEDAIRIKNDIVENLNNILVEVEQELTLNEVSRINKVHDIATQLLKLHPETSDSRLNEIIYNAFKEYFSEDEDVVLLGEDVEFTTSFTSGEYGGAFKVTKNLSEIYKGRVKNTPISESAITGFAIGMALQKRKSIVEIMFGDFVTLTIDQIIQHASKFCTMYKEGLELPFILRTPMGGRRGYGPTHSQSLEKLFFGIPNVNVIALNNRVIRKELLLEILRDVKLPTIIIENKVDYTRKISESYIKTHEYFKTDEKCPTIVMKPIGLDSQLTIFTYGGNLREVEKAAELLYLEHEIAVDIICPLLISPINLSPITESVKKTKNLLTVEEGSSFGGLGSELIAQILGKDISLNKIVQIGNENIIPSSYSAENNLLPSTNMIVDKVLNMFTNE